MLLVLRVVQTVILLAGLACLGYAGWRLYDEIRFLATSVRAQGEVVAFVERLEESEINPTSETMRSNREYAMVTIRHPVVRFRSPVDGRLHRSESSIGYADNRFELGGTVSIRASTREPGEARHPDFLRRFFIPGIILLIGLFATLGPVFTWHLPDPSSARDAEAGMSLFRSVSPVKAAVPIAVLALLAGGLRWWLPWLTPEAVFVLLTDRSKLAVAMRMKPPEPGQILSSTEASIAKLPLVGSGAATSAVFSAIEDGRREDLKRYMAAYRDPALRFPIKIERVRYFGAAARVGDAEAVRILKDAGLDPARDPRALENAVQNGRSAIVRLLAAVGAAPADAGARRDLVDSALRHSDDETLLAIVELGWVDTAQTFDGRIWGAGERGSVLDVALARGLVRSSRELENRGVETASPVLARLVAGDLAGMRALLPEREWAGARVFGVPLLSFAARAGHLAVVRRLVDLGADPTTVGTSEPHAQDLTALDEAVLRGHVHVVSYLASLPGAKGYLDPPNRTPPVGLASERGRWDIVRALIDAGANPSARYADLNVASGATPLHRAAHDGNVEMVEYLLAHGADPRAEAEHDLLPVELAADAAIQVAIEKAGGRGP